MSRTLPFLLKSCTAEPVYGRGDFESSRSSEITGVVFRAVKGVENLQSVSIHVFFKRFNYVAQALPVVHEALRCKANCVTDRPCLTRVNQLFHVAQVYMFLPKDKMLAGFRLDSNPVRPD